jgi:fido (protein-threonine AMPylation protein)
MREAASSVAPIAMPAAAAGLEGGGLVQHPFRDGNGAARFVFLAA